MILDNFQYINAICEPGLSVHVDQYVLHCSEHYTTQK